MTDKARHLMRPLFVILFIVAAGCEEEPPPMTVRVMQNPRAIALGCVQFEEGKDAVGLPVESCTPYMEDEEEAQMQGTLVAYITQTDSGELAVMNVDEDILFDLDVRVPLYSFIPVGLLPRDVAVNPDGRTVYVVNYESMDLTVIPTKDIFKSIPDIFPSIALNGHPESIAISPDGRFMFVSLPDEGMIEILALDAEGCTPVKGTSVCSLGLMDIRSETHIPDFPAADAGVDKDAGSDAGSDASTDGGPDRGGRSLRQGAADGGMDASVDSGGYEEDGGPDVPVFMLANAHPWHLLVSPTGEHLYVSDTKEPYILELDIKHLVGGSVNNDGGSINSSDVINRIFAMGAPTRRIAVSPRVVQEPWLYAADVTNGNIRVIDLSTGILLDVNHDNPLEDEPAIVVPGVVRDIVFVEKRMQDPDSEDYVVGEPATLHGLFAVAASSNGGLYVINVRDERPLGCFKMRKRGEEYNPEFCPRHVLRSAKNILEVEESELPALEGQPVLLSDAGQLEVPSVEYPTLEGWEPGQDNDETVIIPDGGLVPRWGISLNDDPMRALNQTWTMSLNGIIPRAEGFGGNTYEGGLFEDTAVSFCSRGVLGKTDDYAGDILLVLSEPTPIDPEADCSAFYGRMRPYLIREAYDDHLVLKRIKDGPPLPDDACYPMAFEYQIRANGQWVVEGSSSGFLHDTLAGPDAGACYPGEEEASGRTGRAEYGERFNNYFMSFKILKPQEGQARLASHLSYVFEFSTTNGFAPLGASSGDMIASMVLAPNAMILVVDESNHGIVRFYLDPDGIIVNDSDVQ